MTVGVDLAAEPGDTAVAFLDWSQAAVSLSELVLDVDDAALVAFTTQADKVGVDCPLGWPAEFVSFVVAHQGHAVQPVVAAGREWRRRLAFRQTDEVVRAVAGFDPLSVATDWLGLTAMRCALVLAEMARRGHPVDRRGDGAIVEVYPAVSLKQWGLRHRGYKRTENLTVLDQLVDSLVAAAPWLDLGRHDPLCRRNDNASDALIAALTARASALGLTIRPNEAQAIAASSEGWIAIPVTGTQLAALKP
jgi:predicted nuclease with RNAse H fold